MSQPRQLLFLPGAGGDPEFWRPVAEGLKHPASRKLFGWPGFGVVPPDPAIKGIDDLAARIADDIDRPTALIAQSMGGVVAIQLALEFPDQVTHLVLTATSGGVDISDLQVDDWRPAFHASNPTVPRWFADTRRDYTDRLGSVRASVLLLWGDSDPISPVSVGLRLKHGLPRSTLHVLEGGTHDLALRMDAAVVPLIDRHLARAG